MVVIGVQALVVNIGPKNIVVKTDANLRFGAPSCYEARILFLPIAVPVAPLLEELVVALPLEPLLAPADSPPPLPQAARTVQMQTNEDIL